MSLRTKLTGALIGYALCVVWRGALAQPGPAPTAPAPSAPATSAAPATPATPATSAAPAASATPAPTTPATAVASTPAPASDATTAQSTDQRPLLATTREVPEPSALELRVKSASDRVTAVTTKVWRLRDRHTISPSQADALERQLASWFATLTSLHEQVKKLDENKAQAKQKAAPPDEAAKEAQRMKSDEQTLSKQAVTAEAGVAAIDAQLTEADSASGWSLVGTILRARCATAICFDNGDKKDWLGIEPLVELPVGKSLSLSKSSLGNYVDNHELRIDLAAGARVWLFRDIISLSIYISKPLTDGRIRLEGSPFVYPAASVRRPYPGIAVGLLFDSIWLGFDRDELRNGDGQDALAVNSSFPPNSVVSSTWTMTVALQPVTAFRTAIGTAVQATGKQR